MHKYTREQYLAAYERWRQTQRYVIDLAGLQFQERQACLATRNRAWDDYCDARDWVKPGTSRSRRLRREQLAGENVVVLRKTTDSPGPLQ